MKTKKERLEVLEAKIVKLETRLSRVLILRTVPANSSLAVLVSRLCTMEKSRDKLIKHIASKEG